MKTSESRSAILETAESHSGSAASRLSDSMKHFNTMYLIFFVALTMAWSSSPVAAAAEDPTFTAITDSPISEAYAFSVAWGDYDRDGFIDLLAVDFYEPRNPGSGRIYLFQNQGDGSFVKQTLNTAHYQHSGYITGAVWADYDNDGQLDILVSGGGVYVGPNPNILLKQEVNGTFSRSTSPVFPVGYSQAGLWGDFDNDGWLDLFAGYFTHIPPAADVTDILFRNAGDGSFTDSKAVGIDFMNNNEHSTMAGTTGDFNGDGRTDIIVTTILPGFSRLYLNNGSLNFDRILVTPTADAQNYGNGIAVADYDNDGDLDFLTVSKSGDFGWTCACDGPLSGLTTLWRNNGLGEFEQVVAGDLGNSDTIGANGAAWADYNNDGWLDVAVFRGIYSDGRGKNPANLLYRNNGDGTFSRVTTGPIINEDGDARAGAWGDIDNDGDMDLAVANYTWPVGTAGSNRLPLFYRNGGNDNHWLTLSLVGTESNRDAIGAKVRVKANISGQDVWQLRELRTSTGWIAAQSDMRPHFGLGDATVAEMIRIEWPSGTVQELTDVAADRILQIVEPPRLRADSPDTLSWPSAAEGYRLESTTSINGSWSDASEAAEMTGNRMRVTIQAEGGSKFFRLNGQ